ncbi:P-loop containing nucleoside triphosphate hydrolase protein [Xylaria curta]|nr:P-loop containing nucleoside triphosphate hydrolase protein [Xylaria curta]
MSTTNRVGGLRAYGHSDVHVGNNNIVVQAPERPETPPKPSSFIPFCRDSHFIERKTILNRMKQACSAPPSRAALVGLGGVGKSQLAIEYAYRVRDAFKRGNKDIWVFWVHAATRARVEQGFKAIADAVKIRGRNQPNADTLQLVYQWLCNEHNGQWLMVLDSADDINVFYDVSQDGKQPATAKEETKTLRTYLPQSSNGSIIITTRNKDLAFRLTGHPSHVIDVGPMGRADALALLKTKSGSHFDEISGIELVEALGHMPLAIGQAAAYIQQRAPRISVKKYLQEFRQNEQKQFSLLNYDGGDLRREPGAPNSVITTLQITFEHIRSHRRSATELLSLMSFFDCQGIQDYLVQPIFSNGNHKYKAISNNAPEGNTCKEMFEEDIATLRNYSLISANETGDTFEMHGLVQLSTRKWLDMHKETEKFKMACIGRLARTFPPPHFSNWPACRKLFPHVEQAVLYYPKDKELQHLEDFERILHCGGWYSHNQGKYAAAERMLEKALAVAKNLLGTEHEETANVMNSLTMNYMRQQRWEDAEQMLKETLEISKAILKPDDPRMLDYMDHLAQVYNNQGRLDVAELEFTQIIEKCERMLGSEHPDTLISTHNLAIVYIDQKRSQKAELLFKEVVEREKKVLGPEHPDTLGSMHGLASSYIDQKRWQKAESLLEKVVERRKKVLGLEHPDTLSSIHELAFVYNSQERWQEAELLLTQVVERRKWVLGPEHPNTLTSMAVLAYARKGLGYTDEAMELTEQCAQARIRVLGREHPDTQDSLSWLQYWCDEKSQARERRSKPMVGNKEGSNVAESQRSRSRRRRRRHHRDSKSPERARTPARRGFRNLILLWTACILED